MERDSPVACGSWPCLVRLETRPSLHHDLQRHTNACAARGPMLLHNCRCCNDGIWRTCSTHPSTMLIHGCKGSHVSEDGTTSPLRSRQARLAPLCIYCRLHE